MANNCKQSNGFKKFENDFDNLFNIIVKDLVEKQPAETIEAQDWFKKVLNFLFIQIYFISLRREFIHTFFHQRRSKSTDGITVRGDFV